MKKTKKLLTGSAIFVAAIMLMATCIVNPVSAKSSIDAGEEKKQNLTISIEGLLLKFEKDKELQRLIENILEQKNKDIEYNDIRETRTESSFLTTNQDQLRRYSELSDGKNIEYKEAYAEFQRYMEKTYSEDTKKISEDISNLINQLPQKESSSFEPSLNLEENSPSMAVGTWYSSNAEVEANFGFQKIKSDPVKINNDGRRLRGSEDNQVGSIPFDEIDELQRYDPNDGGGGIIENPLKDNPSTQHEKGTLWPGFARTIDGGIIGPDGEIYYPGDPGYQQLLDLEWHMKAHQDDINGINGFTWLELLDGALALGLALGIVSGAVLFTVMTSIIGGILATIVGMGVFSPNGDYCFGIIDILDVIVQSLELGFFMGIESGIWAWNLYWYVLNGGLN